MSLPSDRPARALLVVRLGVGALFLIFAEYKLFGTGFTIGGGYLVWMHGFLDHGATYPFMRPVLEHVAIPAARPLSFLVAFGELSIGLALVLGVLVRTASAFGLTYMLALLFASNYPGDHVAPWRYFGASLDHSVLALCFVGFIVAGPARPTWELWARPKPRML